MLLSSRRLREESLSCLLKPLARVAGSLAIVLGVILLTRLVNRAFRGTLAVQYFACARGEWTSTLAALGLGLPVPFHVIAVGLIVQKRWLSPPWAKAAWFAVVVSGCWLGASLALRLFIL